MHQRGFLIRRTASTSVSPYLSIHSALVARKINKTLFIPVTLSGEKNDEKITVEEDAMIDCGAGDEFIDQNFAQSKNLLLEPLSNPLEVRNVDGTLNKTGTI